MLKTSLCLALSVELWASSSALAELSAFERAVRSSSNQGLQLLREQQRADGGRDVATGSAVFALLEQRVGLDGALIHDG